MALFTAETARSAAQESAAARAKQSAERKAWAKLLRDAQTPKETQADAEPPKDPYVDDLARAQVKYLARLMDPDITAKDAAALSQALKNLRECYHMASGQPKPGTIKPERVSSRQQVKPTSEPKLDPSTPQ